MGRTARTEKLIDRGRAGTRTETVIDTRTETVIDRGGAGTRTDTLSQGQGRNWNRDSYRH